MSNKLRAFVTAIALAFSQIASGIEPVRQAYIPPSPAVSTGGIVQIILSLLLVLATIVAVAWMLKRMNIAQQRTGNQLKMLGGISIGQRERIVLVEIHDTWLVIGVGPGQIRTLHSCSKPEGESGGEDDPQFVDAAGKFSKLLSTVIKNRPSARTSDAP